MGGMGFHKWRIIYEEEREEQRRIESVMRRSVLRWKKTVKYAYLRRWREQASILKLRQMRAKVAFDEMKQFTKQMAYSHWITILGFIEEKEVIKSQQTRGRASSVTRQTADEYARRRVDDVDDVDPSARGTTPTGPSSRELSQEREISELKQALKEMTKVMKSLQEQQQDNNAANKAKLEDENRALRMQLDDSDNFVRRMQAVQRNDQTPPRPSARGGGTNQNSPTKQSPVKYEKTQDIGRSLRTRTGSPQMDAMLRRLGRAATPTREPRERSKSAGVRARATGQSPTPVVRPRSQSPVQSPVRAAPYALSARPSSPVRRSRKLEESDLDDQMSHLSSEQKDKMSKVAAMWAGKSDMQLRKR